MLRHLIVVGLLLMGTSVQAEDKSFGLQAPDALVKTGFLKHLLPRFSLKTGVRIRLNEDPSDAILGENGTPVFRHEGRTWHLSDPQDADSARFLEWLISDVGKRTIDGYVREGVGGFSSDVSVKTVAPQAELTGDAALGSEISLVRCGRCHVVDQRNRMNAIGSSPSFALLRSFPDWQERFETFFLLKPHPAFTQVEGITDPFSESLPSPIAPIEVTWEEIEAITAFVGGMEPADLGAPIQSN